MVDYDYDAIPHSLQAEQSVLGGLLMDNSKWPDVFERINKADFYSETHQTIFKAIHDLAADKLPFDVVIVSDKLRSCNSLEGVGGIQYLTVLLRDTPSAANITHYADIVKEKSALRRLISVGRELSDLALKSDGSKAFDLLESAESQLQSIRTQKASHGFRTMGFSDVLQLELKADWIVTDYIEAHGMGQIFGSSGSGKSFFALDLAYCVGAGVPFFGKKVKKTNVLYVMGEGFSGLKKRGTALQIKYGADNVGVEFSMQAAEIMNVESCMSVADRIMRQEGGFGLVIIDTLNRNMGGGDENSTADMTTFITNVDKYIRSLGCSVIIVHHSGLQNKERARGSSAMYAAIDSEFRVSKDDTSKIITIACTKQKEGESGWEKELILKPVVVGFDEDEQEDIYSCILTEKGVDDGLCERDRLVLDALRVAIANDGIHSPTGYFVYEKTWRDAAYKDIGGKNKSRDFSYAKEKLMEYGYVFEDKNGYFVKNT